MRVVNDEQLQESISSHFGVSAEEICPFHNLNMALKGLINSLKEENVFLYAPLPKMYEKICKKKNIYRVNRLDEEADLPLEESIVIFLNPSQPDGSYHDIDALMQEWMELECTIILDESLLDFSQMRSYTSEVRNYKKLYIIHSFENFYSHVGLQGGAIISSAKNIKKLPEKIQSMTVLNANFLEEYLNNSEYNNSIRAQVNSTKEALLSLLDSSQKFDEIVEGEADFILTHSKEAPLLYKQLRKNGVYVKKCANYDYLNEEWLRFSLENKTSLDVVKESLEINNSF